MAREGGEEKEEERGRGREKTANKMPEKGVMTKEKGVTGLVDEQK